MGRYSLIVVATLILLLTYFVISMSNTSAATIHRNIDSFEYNSAKNIANSAAQLVIDNIINRRGAWNFDAEGDGVITRNPIPYFIGWNELDGSYRIKYIAKNSAEDKLTVIVSGQSKGRIYDTTVHFKRVQETSALFDYAAYSEYDLTVGTNGYIDSYNSDISNTYTANAKVGYGPNGTFTNNGTINGPVSHKVEKVMTPLSYPPDAGEVHGSIYGSLVFDGGGEDKEYRIEDNISLAGNDNLEFRNGSFTLYVTGDISTAGNAQITIHNDASVTMYIDGNLDAKGNGLVNHTNVAKNLLIFGTENSNMLVDLQGSTNSTFVGAIYAPTADIKIYGGNDFTVKGAVIGKNIEINRALIYDEALADSDDDLVVTADNIYVLSWE